MADVHEWLGGFHFSRGTRHLARDFSDAVLLAELLAQLVPAWVELHNYPSANRVQHKLVNWETLNRKVLVRIKCELSRKQQEDLAHAVPGAIDLVLAQVRKQTSKDDSHKASFKSSAPSPRARLAEAAAPASATILKSPKRYSTESPRSPGPYPPECRPGSPSSTRTASDAPPKSPRTNRLPAYSLNDFLSTPSPRPDQDDIAASFLKLLELMSTSDAQSSEIAKPKANTGIQHNKQPLTPDSKRTKLSSSVFKVRPASADSRASSQRLRATEHAKPVSKATQETKRAGDTDGHNDSSPPQQPATAIDLQHVPNVEFAESALVYFCCQDEPPVRDEQQAWQQHERVQVARFVRPLPSGDCVVQLLKLDRDTEVSRGVKSFVSTPHFIECCGSQLHNIQSMRFDATEAKWKWFGPEYSNSRSSSTNKVPDASWKRSLLIAIAPDVRSISAGPRTDPVRKTCSVYPVVMTKRTSHGSHFFTEVLSRVKCNAISLDEPVAIVGKAIDKGADGTLCADFIETVYDTIGFDSPAAPTVFPRVRADVLLDIPEKKLSASPTRARKSNAEPVEAT